MLLLNSLRGMIRRVTARRTASRRPPGRSCLKRRLVIEELESRQLLSAQPNFVFIITDDQDAETVQFMPRLQSLLADQGTTFPNMFVTTSLCCPSHVSILTGQYAHNHGVLTNTLPLGGFQRFQQLNGDQSTLATWLHDAGYFTGRVGKYLVGYPTGSTYVPPGWDEWHSSYGGFSTYFNYSLNENGTVVSYGNQPEDYLTDVFAQKAVDFLDRAETNDAQPFFLFFSPNPPHSGTTGNGPPTPAPRHANLFPGVQAPRPPSFNEANVSDKPPAISSLPLLTGTQIAAIDSEYRSRLQALQAMDEAIERIVTALAERGELENTYLIFTSDNGYFLGEHRIRNGKGQIYEEAIRVPLIVRGPGVPQGATNEHMVLNIDFAPTIAQLGEAQPSRVLDGRSLVPLLQQGPPPLEQWRQDFLVELYQPDIRALRTRNEVYVEYASGPRELYDLANDPFQLTSLHASADPAHLQALSARLAELATSGGPPTLRVTSFAAGNSLITANFSMPFDPAVINLYDGVNGTLGAADVTVVGAVNGTIRGSLLLNATNTGFTWIATGGLLPADTYTVTIRSAVNAFRTPGGDLLDGNADTTAGDNFTTTFTVNPSSAIAVGIADFTRGPGQTITVPATSEAAGIPLRLSNGDGVTSIELTLTYNPALLDVTGAELVANLPPNSTVSVDDLSSGQITLTFTSPTSLPAGPVEFARLLAVVPNDAPYTSKHLLDLTSIRINNGAIAARDDDAIHIVGYLGDVTGNAAYSSLDAARVLRVAVGLETGFGAYQLADPAIIADITGNGLVNSADATRILQEAIGLDRPEIPALPGVIPPIVPGGPDPLLSIPTTLTGRPGDTLTVPVDLDLSDGLESVDLALAYDSSRLEILSIGDIGRGSLTGDFDLFSFNLEEPAGTLRVGLGRSAGPISGRGSGSVLEITFRIRPEAPAGTAVVNLLEELGPTHTQLNEGGLVLTPAPSNEAGDALDGLVVVEPELVPTVQHTVIKDGSLQHSVVTRITVTFSSAVRFLGNPANAFRLFGPRGAVRLRDVARVDENGRRTVVQLTFTGRGTRNGSLLNSRYTLTIDGDRIVDAAGQAVDGDQDGVPGGDAVEAFFRLHGDGNGDGKVGGEAYHLRGQKPRRFH